MTSGTKALLLVGCLLMASLIAYLARPAARQGIRTLEKRESQADRILAERPQALGQASAVAKATPTGRLCVQAAQRGVTQAGAFTAEYEGDGWYRVRYEAGPGAAAPPGPRERRLRVEWRVRPRTQEAAVTTLANPF
jgi:hypothetical protein